MSTRQIEVRPCKDMGGHVRRTMGDERPDFWGVYLMTAGIAEWLEDHADEASAQAAAVKLRDEEGIT